MKLLSVFVLLFLSLNVVAQTSEEVLATANNQTFTSRDLAPGIREAFDNLPKVVAEKRKELLEEQIAGNLFEVEAAARKTTVEKLFQKEVSLKIPNPTDAQVQAVYDANRASIGDKTIKEMLPQITVFLRRDLEQKAYTDYIATLKTRHKVTIGKDVNAPNLAQTDSLATVGSRQITVAAFDKRNKLAIYELQAEIYDQTRDALEQFLFSTLLVAEAKAQNVQASDIIAREITDKLREFADAERDQLENNLQKKLYQKFNTKVLLKDPSPVAQNVTIDGSPSKGKTDAPLTIVMFSDFQCSHCAAAHPVLQKVMAEYADKVRFVVRNYPLESIHADAFRAALAAQAAHAQGKFFEYIELLYKNQSKLDVESLKKYAAEIGLNQKQFDLDLGSEKFAAVVRRDLQDGTKYGVAATPTVYINGIKVRSNSGRGFRRAIERALKQ
jgi:protein-disulfide isomerase